MEAAFHPQQMFDCTFSARACVPGHGVSNSAAYFGFFPQFVHKVLRAWHSAASASSLSGRPSAGRHSVNLHFSKGQRNEAGAGKVQFVVCLESRAAQA